MLTVLFQQKFGATNSLAGVSQEICRHFVLPFQLRGLCSIKDTRNYGVIAVDSLGESIRAYAIRWYVRKLADEVSKQTVHHFASLVWAPRV
jgi:hypothetical protein